MQSLFTPKDRTANRYFQKRAHYLTVIASSFSTLIESKKNQKTQPKVELDEVWKTVRVEWEWVGGDERRAGLVLSVPKSEL
jgi:hypothetical protein